MGERVGAPVARGGDRIAEPASGPAPRRASTASRTRRRQACTTPPPGFCARNARHPATAPPRPGGALLCSPRRALGPHFHRLRRCCLGDRGGRRASRVRRRAPITVAPRPRRAAARRERRALAPVAPAAPRPRGGPEPLRAREVGGSALVIEAPAEIRPWVADHFGRLLQACAAAVLGPEVEVDLVASDAPAGPPPSAPATTAAAAAINPRYTFEQFVIGDANRLAHAAALAVAEMPGLAYNPLYICGPPGLGKTHLLHSIAAYVTDHGGGLSVLYTTAEAFTDQFVGALHGGAIEAFKAAYRGVDVLLVDDVQFLQSKTRTEQEFFHTFNALHGAGAQLVLTSDRLPRDMDAM